MSVAACCDKYRESSKKRILKTKPIPVVSPRNCETCDYHRGQGAALWCTSRNDAVDPKNCCDKYKEDAIVALLELPQATPLEPSQEAKLGDTIDVMVGPPYKLIWIGNQIIIGQDGKGKEHAFDIKSMRFRKC